LANSASLRLLSHVTQRLHSNLARQVVTHHVRYFYSPCGHNSDAERVPRRRGIPTVTLISALPPETSEVSIAL
jgi:hypothetical protein